jgi:DNA-binding transcriptional ArsR family regulator
VIRVHLTDGDLVSLRLTYGPYWDILGAALAGRPVPPSAAPRQRALLASAGALGALPAIRVLRGRPLPSFLVPLTDPGDDLGTTLERVLAVRADDVDAELEDLATVEPATGGSLQAAWANPRAVLEGIAASFWAAWEDRFATDWPAIEAIHEGDIVYRSLALTRGGPHDLLDELRPAAWLDGDDLCVARPTETVVAPGGSGVTLVSSVFAPDELLTGRSPGGRWCVVHPPVGRSLLWLPDDTNPTDQLSGLIGPVRAQILVALEVPRTTSDIAQLCHLAPNTASYHLARLRDAGMVESSRAGRRSYYRLAGRGAQLLSLWSERSAA